MRKFLILLAWVFVASAAVTITTGQSLDIAQETTPGGESTVSINFAPEGTEVVALQYDLQFNTRKINMAALQLTRGKVLSSEHGFEFRQVQPGIVRVVIYPPIRRQMPALADGQTASLKFSDLNSAGLEDGDIRFVPGSIVLSDPTAKAVALRTSSSSLSRDKGRKK